MAKPLKYDNTNTVIAEMDMEAAITYVFNEGGNVLTTGVKGDLEIPFDCEINAYSLVANETGSIQIDIWLKEIIWFPPTNSDSITGSNEPALSSSDWTRDGTLTGWSTTISAHNVLRFNIDSVVDITRCTLTLEVIRT